MTKKAKPEIVLAVVSDLHCGSSVALCPDEEITQDDGGTYHPSKVQQWLHERWVEYWDSVAALTEAYEADLHIILNGDLVDGDHHGTLQLVSRDLNVQGWMLRRLSQTFLDLNPKSVVVVRGTETHVGPSAGAEEAYARWLVQQGVDTRRDTTGMHSHWHFKGKYGETLVDAAHHGRVGARPWTRLNQANALAAEIVLNHANRGDPIPDLAFRSHYHTKVDTGNEHRTRVVGTAAWQLHTGFAHKVVPEVISDIGGHIVTGLYDPEPQVQHVLFAPLRPPTHDMG